MTFLSPRRVILTIVALAVPLTALAQSRGAAAAPVPASTAQAVEAQPDPDLQLVQGEPDFTLSALPTTLRMPSGKFAFRLTHRFSLPVNSGTTGDFFKNFFNFDSSAQIGFELRYGLAPGTQVTVHRTNERTIQFMGQHQVAADSAGSLSVDVLAAVEGRENFSERFATTIGGVVSSRFGTHGAMYVEPMVVLNANTDPIGDEPRYAAIVGVGARLRIGSRSYVTAEFAPRLTSGFHPGVDHVTFGIEKRAGGHVFQLNVSNDLGTTFGQIARGGPFAGKWYIGFNLTRKFY